MSAAAPAVPAAAPAGQARHLRWLIVLAYVVNGFCLSAWNVRLPAIADIGGLDATGLGRFLTAGALGTLVTVPLMGRWVARSGAGRVYLAATGLFVLAYVGLALALAHGGQIALLGANVLHGVAFAATNVPQSLLGTKAEQRQGRSILSQFHAAYSIAAAVGAAAGGALAAAGVGPGQEFVLLAILALAVRGVVSWAIRHDQDAARPTGTCTPAAHRATAKALWWQPQVLLLGVVVFGAGVCEGAANNWVSPALVSLFPVGESTAATAVSTFLVAQTLGRLAGGRLVDRIGARATLVASGLTAAVGTLVFSTAPQAWICWIGVALWGLGAALPVPVAVSIAARAPDAAGRIAAVVSVSSLANVAGPPAIGAAAGLLGYRWALAGVAVLVLLGVPAGRAAVREQTDPT